VPYVFNGLDQSKRPWTGEDRKIADTMGAYWVNFMKTGDPNGEGLPRWLAFTSKQAVTMELGGSFKPRRVADQARLAFWEKYLLRPNAIAR
jgi:carboxylesterase type B